MEKIKELILRYPQLVLCEKEIEGGYELLAETYRRGGKVLACGNGGSASDAQHIVGELMKSFVRKRSIGEARQKLFDALAPEDAAYIAEHLQGTLTAISLQGETALVSAFANDVAPDLVYAQQVLGYGAPGDCLLALSTSGNAENVLRAVQVAKALGIKTLGMTGAAGGRLKAICDVCIRVPETETYKVQELHLPVYHAVCLMLEERFFGEVSI